VTPGREQAFGYQLSAIGYQLVSAPVEGRKLMADG